MAESWESIHPADLRPRLEAVRLDMLALFRALDLLAFTPAQLPRRQLRALFELDADFAEALWALDQPPGAISMELMVRDTCDSLDEVAGATAGLLSRLPNNVLPLLEETRKTTRDRLPPHEAYNMVPGRDPNACR